MARSVMAAEFQALVLGCENTFFFKYLSEELIGSEIQLEAIIDRRTVFIGIALDGKKTERRLQIDVLAFRQS